jgi:hypothetical protein
VLVEEMRSFEAYCVAPKVVSLAAPGIMSKHSARATPCARISTADSPKTASNGTTFQGR